MADRAVGTASSYPLDRTHLPPCDEIACHAGDKASSPVYPSRIKYGDPTSPFGGASVLPPPVIPDTTIGTVIVSGDTGGQVNDSGSYTATASGDATPFSYKWSAVGGTVRGSGNARTCTVDWTIEGAGTVTCVVSSADPGVTDSPQSDTMNVTVAPEPPPPTQIGDISITGPASVTEGETHGYVANTPDQSRDSVLAWSWSAVGGTILSEDLGTCSVQWGAAGSGSVSVTIIDSAPGKTDSPKSKSQDVTIAVLFSLPSIGDVTFSGPQNPTEKTDASYTANNDGDASGLTYFWSVKNGTIKGSNSNKKVDLTCGNAGNMELTCEVNSSDPDVIDAPQTVASNIPVAMAPAYIGKVTVSGMSTMFLGDEETFTCSFDGNINSPIYRWKLAGVGGEIITFGGLSDDKVGVRAQSPGSFDVICEIDADDWMVEDRGASGKLSVQVQT